jgi:hypothetical protein
MPRLTKLWVAYLYERKNKQPFAHPIILADSFDEAEDIATRWAEQKHNGRVVKIRIEKSKKGEVVADD